MKIRAPFVYEAMVIPRKARNERHKFFGEWTEVEIREVSDIEAPVALSWKDSEFQPSGIDGVCERRWFNGSLWEPEAFKYSGKPNEHVTLEQLKEWTEKAWTYSPLIKGPDWRVREVVEGKTVPLDPDDYRRVLSSGREDALRKVQEAADSIISIDGKVWWRTFEPVYRIKVSGGFRETFWVEVTRPPAAGESHEGIFRIDRFDDLAAYALERWGYVVPEQDRVAVLLPECVRYDDETPALISALRSAVQCEEREIAEKDRATVIAWVDMRDATRRLDADPDPRAITEAVEAAETWLQVAGSYDFRKDRLRKAIDRWNARPIPLDDQQEPSFGMR